MKINMYVILKTFGHGCTSLVKTKLSFPFLNVFNSLFIHLFICLIVYFHFLFYVKLRHDSTSLMADVSTSVENSYSILLFIIRSDSNV